MALLAAPPPAGAEPYLQLELGLVPRTEVDAKVGQEHLKIDTVPSAAGSAAVGWGIGAWRTQLSFGYRHLDSDGVLDAGFQANGSLTLWSGLIEVLRDFDLPASAPGRSLEAFAGLGAGLAYADLHDFGTGSGSEVVPMGMTQLGLAWRLQPRLALLGGGRALVTGSFDSPGRNRGELETSGRLRAVELFVGLRLGF